MKQMGQTEPSQVWLGSNYTYVQYKSYSFSLVEAAKAWNQLCFLMFKTVWKMLKFNAFEKDYAQT